MKSITPLLFVFALSLPAWADDPKALQNEIDSLVQKRIALRTTIVESLRKQAEAGAADSDHLHRAEVDLFQLSRDSAKTAAERLPWQDRIISVYEEAYSSAKQRFAAGEVTHEDLLRAEEALIAAQQKRLELQLTK